jgi:hypothetical protein
MTTQVDRLKVEEGRRLLRLKGYRPKAEGFQECADTNFSLQPKHLRESGVFH